MKPARVIVVDNWSTDGSNIGLKNYCAGVELLQMNSNVGFAAANNIAIKQITQCEWVALLYPDTVPDSRWLLALSHAALQNSGVDSFASKLASLMNNDELDGTGGMYHVSGVAWRRYHRVIDDGCLDTSKPIFSPCAAAGLYRLEKLKQVGGFDEDYFCYCEDVDLGFRLRLSGCQSIYVPESWVQHKGQGISGNNSDFALYYGHRNLVWTYFKNMPTKLLWLYLPQHLLIDLVAVLGYTAKGRAGVILKAKWDAIRGLKKILEKRKLVQESRTASDAEIKKSMVTGWLRICFRRYK